MVLLLFCFPNDQSHEPLPLKTLSVSGTLISSSSPPCFFCQHQCHLHPKLADSSTPRIPFPASAPFSVIPHSAIIPTLPSSPRFVSQGSYRKPQPSSHARVSYPISQLSNLPAIQSPSHPISQLSNLPAIQSPCPASFLRNRNSRKRVFCTRKRATGSDR